MSLKQCIECSTEINSKVIKCPNCGMKQKRTGFLKIIGVVLGGLLFLGIIGNFGNDTHTTSNSSSTAIATIEDQRTAEATDSATSLVSENIDESSIEDTQPEMTWSNFVNEARNIVNTVASEAKVYPVKNGYFFHDKSLTIGQAFKSYPYFSDTEWNSFQTDKGRNIVEFNGLVDLNKIPNNNISRLDSIIAIVQFVINQDDTFEVLYSGIQFTLPDKSAYTQELDIEQTITALYNNNEFIVNSASYIVSELH